MATQIKSDAEVFIQNENDLRGNGKDGLTASTATRLGQVNSDIGYTNSFEATTDTGDFSFISLFKRFLNTKLGSISEAASATGGLLARLRAIADNTTFTKNTGTVDSTTIRATVATDGALMTRLGTNGVAASATGSESAQLRLIGESLAPTQPAPSVYRSTITTNDVLANPTVGTATAQTGGSLTAVAHHIRVVGVNAYGRTTTVTPGGSPVTTGASGAIRIPITVGSFTHFDIYLSTATDPLFVGRASAAQVTAGDTLTVAATSTANATFSGTGTAGNIEVRVVGTGTAASAAAQNTAYVIPASPINCDGKDFAYFDLEFVRTSAFADFACTIVPFFLDATASNTYFAGEALPISFGGGSGQVNATKQRIRVEVGGSPGVALCINGLSANTTVNIWRVLR